MCLCPCLSTYNGSETSPRPHMRHGSQVCVQEEDETSLPQKIPPCFSFHCSKGWRGHTPWTVVYEAPPMPTLSDVAVSQTFSTQPQSCDSTSPRHRLHPRS